MFESLGISRQTENVYLTMLRQPQSGLSDIARALALTEDQVRVSLDELAKMQLARVSWADPDAVRPVSPEVGLAALLARQQTQLAQRQQEYEESRAAFAALLSTHAEFRAKAPEPGIEQLNGIDEIRDRLRALAAECEWEACSFMPGGAQSEAGLAASRSLDAEVIERGVRLRTVYLDSVRNDQPTLEYAMWLAELGSEVRTAPALPLRMLIVDRRIALVPVDSDDSAAMALVISSSGVVTALMALFQSVWKGATPLGISPAAARRRDAEGLSPQERQVLKLLGEGHTDEMIARRLAVSPRTARRVASDLLTRLGARSRFQAGARAVVRGLLEPDDIE